MKSTEALELSNKNIDKKYSKIRLQVEIMTSIKRECLKGHKNLTFTLPKNVLQDNVDDTLSWLSEYGYDTLLIIAGQYNSKYPLRQIRVSWEQVIDQEIVNPPKQQVSKPDYEFNITVDGFFWFLVCLAILWIILKVIS